MKNNDTINEFANINYTNLGEWLSNLNAYEFTLIGTLLGFLIAPQLSVNLQNSVGNFFELIGQVILTINAQNVTNNPNSANITKSNPNPETLSKEYILSLENTLLEIKRDISRLKNNF